MNWLDLILIVCIVIGIIKGMFDGLVKQVISLIALILAIVLSGTVANGLRQLINAHFSTGNTLFSPNIINAIYYILAFVIIVSLFALLAKAVDKMISYTPVGIFNRLFGALFGGFVWTLCLSILLNFIVVFDTQSVLLPKPLKEKSICYHNVRMVFPSVFPYIKEFFKC
jgi:membrane protein required for colicin V production